MEQSSVIQKITIIFPPGDQLTSLLIEKEANTKIEDLLNRLCTLRAIQFDLQKLLVLNDVKQSVNLNQTVRESGLCYIEIVDKKDFEEKSQKKNKRNNVTGKPPPANCKPTPGKLCYLPLEVQLFDEEKSALAELKKLHPDLCSNFSDEFMANCLIVRKLDIKRTVETLQINIQFRKDNGFIQIPKFSELPPELFEVWHTVPGARDKLGRSVKTIKMGFIPGVEPYTLANVKKFWTWIFYIGVYSDGFDGIRCGLHLVNDAENISWKSFDLDFQKNFTKMLIETFPVLVRQVEIVNPPMMFSAFFSIMKTFVKKKVTDRVLVTTVKKITKHISADNLTDSLGGNVKRVKGDWYEHMKEWAEKREASLAVPLK